MYGKIHGLDYNTINDAIKRLIHHLVNIKDDSGEFLLHLDDGRIIDTKGWNGWEWTHGIGLYGIWKYHLLTGDEESLKILEDWFTARFAEGTTKNINTMSPFLTLACMYEKFQTPRYLPWLDTWAEWAMYELPRTKYGGMQHITYNSENKHQLWDDTLMMTVLPLAKIGLVLNRPHYVEEAKRQFLIHIQYLCDVKTGLFFHGWEFTTPETPAPASEDTTSILPSQGHNFANALWARGNSWLTIAIPEFLTLLNQHHAQHPSPTSTMPTPPFTSTPTDPITPHLLSTLHAQASSLAHLQDPSTGLWNTLLNLPSTPPHNSYPETSATAGFAYGLLTSIRHRYLASSPFEDVAAKAVQGVLDNLSPEGELLGVSFGTAMGRDLKFYTDIPRTSMPYGQAMAIMALGEFLQRFV